MSITRGHMHPLRLIAELLHHAATHLECRQPMAPSSPFDGVPNQLAQLLKGQVLMSDKLDNLTDKITRMESVGDGMVTLLGELSARIKAAGTDETKLDALATEIDARTGTWAQAVTANTPVADEPAPVTPAPEPTTDTPPAETTVEPTPVAVAPADINPAMPPS